MTKGSKGRRGRAEAARHAEAAERFLKVGKSGEALRSLQAAVRLVPDDADILARFGYSLLLTRNLRQAVEVLRRAIALRPDAAEVHEHLGVALQLIGDDESAIASYREAVRLSPDLGRAQGQLGELLFAKGRRSEAATALGRASAIEPGTPRARYLGALAHFAMDRLGEAEEELRQALALDPSNDKALQLLGLILQLAGQAKESEALFERAIQVDPLSANAYNGLVTSRKFTETDRPWIERILSQLESTDWQRKFAPVEVERRRMTLHFAAGKVMDDLGDYAAAMKQFDAANRIRRGLVPFNREAVERRVDRFIKRFTPEHLANRATIGNDDRTPILIVGLPRSGTSLLERIVSSHPEVRGRGELDFWNECGPRWADAEPVALAKVADQLRGDYLRLLRGGAPDTIRATDKMPFNFYWVGLVHLLFPNAIILHCRRNPADACLSIYMTLFAVVWDFQSSMADLSTYHRLYSRLMDHWRAVIPSNRLMDVDYEDIVGEPEKTARSVIEFCGLDWNPACLHPEKNRQAVATASHWQARQPIYRSSVERWRHYEPWIGELRELIGPPT
jgi:tetratricopeptide (TPR) repeat protein